MNSNVLFLLFSFFLVLSSVMVILSNHPVFSLLFLVSCFLNSSLLLFFLECEFLALLFVIIYVGAIAVLFLFVIMMLESKAIDLSKNVIKYVPMGSFFILLLLIPIFDLINFEFDNSYMNSFYVNYYQNWYDLINSITDVEVYGKVLYSHYVVHFLVAGFILLLVLICVVYLTNNFNKTRKLEQSTLKQLSRNTNFFS